jgi:hypothetical protein
MADTLDGNDARTSVKISRKMIAFFNMMSSSRIETDGGVPACLQWNWLLKLVP